MNLAVFLPNWIGDVAMATPALRALRRRFAAPMRLFGVLRPYVADVLAGTNWLDEQWLFDPRGDDSGLRSAALVRRLRAAEIDKAVLFTNSFRTAWLAWRGGCIERVGFARSFRGPLLTRKLQPRREGRRFVPTPIVDDYLSLTYAIGCPPESPRLELATLPGDEAAADEVWRRFGWSRFERVVVLNSGAAFGAAKMWPVESFGQLARRIAVRHDAAVLTLCGPGERDQSRRIVHEAGHPRVVSLADATPSIGLSKACVKRAALMVTTDSGPRHFAAAFGVPVVTLFGPTHIAWSETHFPRATHLQHAVPCGPCQQRVCPLGHHRCMRDLTVDTVYAAVARQLSETYVSRAA